MNSVRSGKLRLKKQHEKQGKSACLCPRSRDDCEVLHLKKATSAQVGFAERPGKGTYAMPLFFITLTIVISLSISLSISITITITMIITITIIFNFTILPCESKIREWQPGQSDHGSNNSNQHEKDDNCSGCSQNNLLFLFEGCL